MTSFMILLQILAFAILLALVTFLLLYSIFDLIKNRTSKAPPINLKLPATSYKLSRTTGSRYAGQAVPWPALNDQTPSAWKRNVSWSGLPQAWVDKTLVMLIIFLVASVIFNASRLLFLLVILTVLVVGSVLWNATQRRKKFSQQLPDALDALVHGLRAGYALPHALALVERETHEPVCLVFRALARAQDYRLNFEQAVKMMDHQLQLAEWTLVAEALSLQQRLGGNIIPVLTKITEGLRDRMRMEQEIHTATASGKFSGLMISALAPFSFFLFYFFSPDYVGVLVHSTIGIALLTAAALLEVVGFLFIWQIVALDY